LGYIERFERHLKPSAFVFRDCQIVAV
jgi:hypothetical protein